MAIREATGAPVCVGFGIKTPEDAARVAAVADGVVVGSAAVQTIAEGGSLRDFVTGLREAIDGKP